MQQQRPVTGNKGLQRTPGQEETASMQRQPAYRLRGREYSGEFGFTQLPEFDVNFSVSVSAREQKSNWQGIQSHVWTQATTQQGGADIDEATCGMLRLMKGSTKRAIYKPYGG
ncbi:hypothetical protein E2C01_036749 [Portunus trituberculatus]|uniref:Uncharacterized protein n=1 Tax=Portunus trituberculatus TaxID=210409 RepID=A0A5B7F9I6_PORTR|nr:hypothetical protein [Portunus trituberculatus]